MKILINDKVDEECINSYNGPMELDTKKKDPTTLLDVIDQYDGLIVRSSTKVNKEIIEKGVKGKLKVIGRVGTGIDNIDLKSAYKNGIIIKNTPYGNVNSVAEHIVGLMFAVSRNIPQADESLKNGIWQKAPYVGYQLRGKTLGFIGCGNVGQTTSELALGLNMEVIGYDKHRKKVKEFFPNSNIAYVSKSRVLKESDFLSINTDGSEVVIGEKELSMMKPTAYLINTSRGRSIDEEALYKALYSNTLKGAALDVFLNEPEKDNSEFISKFTDKNLKNVVLTPHLGASTIEALKETTGDCLQVVSDCLLIGDLSKAYNTEKKIVTSKTPVDTVFIHHPNTDSIFVNIDAVFSSYKVNIRDNNSSPFIRKGGKEAKNAISIYRLNKDQDIDKETFGEIIKKINQYLETVRSPYYNYWAKI